MPLWPIYCFNNSLTFSVMSLVYCLWFCRYTILIHVNSCAASTWRCDMWLPAHMQHAFMLPCLLLPDVCTYVSKGFYFIVGTTLQLYQALLVPSSQNEIFSEGCPKVKPHRSSEYYQRWEATGLYEGWRRPNEKKGSSWNNWEESGKKNIKLQTET